MGELQQHDSCCGTLEGYGKAKHVRRASTELYLPQHYYIGHGFKMAEPIDSALYASILTLRAALLTDRGTVTF